MLVSPIGPLMIAVKKFLRLVQGVSVLVVDLTERLKETKSGEKKQYVENLFDSVIEKYFGEQAQSKLGRLIQQKMSGLYFRDLAVLILNLLIITRIVQCQKVFED